jgi:hydroxyacylglutathione hydrolase
MNLSANLVALPAFADNYLWMLDDGRCALVVDPGDSAPVQRALDERGLELAAILVTHHHPDHIGGIDALRPRLRGPVHGPARERIPEPFEPRVDGDRIEVLGLTFTVIDVPGHTAGHIAYYCEAVNGAPLLFCGDTLFSGGCGRLFEGTPAQMLASLSALAALPSNTRVCCTHEYTLANLRFARQAEPGNAELVAYEARCQALRAEGAITLPSTIGLERQINPFLRCTEPELIASARAQGATDDSPVAVFAALREWKNRSR